MNAENRAAEKAAFVYGVAYDLTLTKIRSMTLKRVLLVERDVARE